jgi:plastocyanin
VYAAITVIAATAVLGVATAATGAETATEYTVTGAASDAVWHPSTLTVQTGDTVTWTFETGSFHNVRATSANWTFTSGDPPSQDPASYTFTAPGTFDFACEVHPGMTGTITVQDAPVTPTPSPSPTPTPTPTPTTSPSPIPQPSGHTTPPPTGGSDTVKPTIRKVRLKAMRHAIRVRFRISERATVTLRAKRWLTHIVVKSARVQVAAGTRTVKLRSQRLKQGRYTVDLRARDALGNRSRLAARRLTLRRWR